MAEGYPDQESDPPRDKGLQPTGNELRPCRRPTMLREKSEQKLSVISLRCHQAIPGIGVALRSTSRCPCR